MSTGMPVGLPRPQVDGLPVPWITRIAGGRVWWVDIDLDRHLASQISWICQVCGLDLPPTACVVVDPRGEVVTSAALHERCARIAMQVCPALHRGTPATHDYRLVRVTADDILSDGYPYVPGTPQVARTDWTLRTPLDD